MKRFSLFAIVVLFVCTGAFAEIGILVGGGVNISNLNGTGDYNTSGLKMRTGYNINWDYWYAFDQTWSVLAGVQVETRGTNILNYFEVPVHVKYNLLPVMEKNILNDLSVSLGPEWGIRYSDNVGLQKYDIGAGIDASCLLLKTFVVGVGYSRGFRNIDLYPNGKSGSLTNYAIKAFIDYKWTATK